MLKCLGMTPRIGLAFLGEKLSNATVDDGMDSAVVVEGIVIQKIQQFLNGFHRAGVCRKIEILVENSAFLR